MLYRLDRNIEDLLSFLSAQVTDPRQVVVTLTAAHGTSPSHNTPGKEQERFNIRQAEVITNAFIGSQHGNGEWILGCIDRAFYLNHNLIYEKGLSIAEIQHDIATFLMQLRGVSHAVSAEAMRNTYFGSGYGRKIQNGYYPRRSGDVIINLMPEWIESRDEVVSMSGSMYGYDTHVPLIFWGAGIVPQRTNEPVCMTSVAPTIARLMGIAEPAASEGVALNIKQN
jgi:arylsulfatase A-like enzyme